MSNLRKVVHSVVAFYGISAESLKDVFERTLDWIARLGQTPHLMGTDLDKGKLIRFGNSAKRLKTKGFSSVTFFELVSLPDSGSNQLDGVNAEISMQINKYYSNLIIDFSAEVLQLPSEQSLEIAKDACVLVDPKYGIGFQRPFNLGPVLYAMGMAKGDVPDEEGDRISEWVEALRHGLHDRGLMRDLFPWNFLTISHLNAKVGKYNLPDWILQDSQRGVLTELTNRVFLWTLKESLIPKVRKALADANIIFDYDKHIQAPLELLNPHFDSPQEAADFFQAWVGRTPDEMIEWYKQKYVSSLPK